MRDIHFDERYSASYDPFTPPQGDNHKRLRRLRRYLPEAMEDLTERQKEMVRMHFFDEKTVSDIARELEVNRSTVSRCLSRAEKRLLRTLRFTL
ncbi:MAG: sigma-70 family RNA polymerase sigma factor [Oscillospiraceae bacterium]|nr:sigma-70 family RNA polymerase sigma factor [Oscillospiraceae bacterium]